MDLYRFCTAFFGMFLVIVLAALCLSSYQYNNLKSQHDNLRDEAVKRNYATWTVDQETKTVKFQWK